jgi:hypothetical protein
VPAPQAHECRGATEPGTNSHGLTQGHGCRGARVWHPPDGSTQSRRQHNGTSHLGPEATLPLHQSVWHTWPTRSPSRMTRRPCWTCPLDGWRRVATSCLLASRAEAAQHRWSEHLYPENPNARDSDDWLRLQSAQCVGTRRSEGLATPSDAGVTCAGRHYTWCTRVVAHTEHRYPSHVVVRWCISPDLGLRSAVVDARTSSSCSLVSVAVIAHPVRSGHFYIPRSTGTRHESLEACVRSTVSREASG